VGAAEAVKGHSTVPVEIQNALNGNKVTDTGLARNINLLRRIFQIND
jgi:hypothetical protein